MRRFDTSLRKDIVSLNVNNSHKYEFVRQCRDISFRQRKVRIFTVIFPAEIFNRLRVIYKKLNKVIAVLTSVYYKPSGMYEVCYPADIKIRLKRYCVKFPFCLSPKLHRYFETRYEAKCYFVYICNLLSALSGWMS